MCQRFLADSRLYPFLLQVDADIATRCREAGCSCGGRLHSARYPRKPRGTPETGLDPDFSFRFSFCCDRKGCRTRQTSSLGKILRSKGLPLRRRPPRLRHAKRSEPSDRPEAPGALRRRPADARPVAGLLDPAFPRFPLLEVGPGTPRASRPGGPPSLLPPRADRDRRSDREAPPRPPIPVAGALSRPGPGGPSRSPIRLSRRSSSPDRRAF